MRPLVMGVLNVTPDSFSDGGMYFDREAAIARGMEMVGEGADVVDVGGESSRPGAEPVPEDEEKRRVLPVVEALSGVGRVSIDTCKADVARAAVRAGASVINDIGASLQRVAAELGVAWVAMHMRGRPKTMQVEPRYDDVAREVREFLVERAELALSLGVPEVWIDPGIGFGKTAAHNLLLLKHLPELVRTGHPVLVGASRKSFLGGLLAEKGGEASAVQDRLEGSLAAATWAMVQGARMVRAHDVSRDRPSCHLGGRSWPAGGGCRGRAVPSMRGKWAAGISPRNFAWVLREQLAISERPGGYARNHRRVRRQEEIFWLRGQGFTRVVSLLASPHNLHAYDELEMPWAHFPFGINSDARQVLVDLYKHIDAWLAAGERLLVHQEELGDRLMGVAAGYLLWTGRLATGPQAVAVLEQIVRRQMGPLGRELVALEPELGPGGGR